MAEKPTTLPRWGDVGGDIVEPPEGKKNIGWEVDETPPAQWFNWLINNAYQWIQYVDTPVGTGTGPGFAATGGATNGSGLKGTGGATNGKGVEGQGTGSGAGVYGAGGAAGGDGVYGVATGNDGRGTVGLGDGTGAGVHGLGGSSAGPGVLGSGGTGGIGVSGLGNGVASGVKGTGGATGAGVEGVGGSTSGAGVKGSATSGSGVEGSSASGRGGTFTAGGSGIVYGISSTGADKGAGIYAEGGDHSGGGAAQDSAGIRAVGGATGGHGIYAEVQGSNSYGGYFLPPSSDNKGAIKVGLNSNTALPSNPDGGDLSYSAHGLNFKESGLPLYRMSGITSRDFTPETETTNTVFSGHSYTVPANLVNQLGATIKIRVWGLAGYSAGSGAWTLRLRVNADTGYYAIAQNSGAINEVFYGEWILVTTTVGASGVLDQAYFAVVNGSGNGADNQAAAGSTDVQNLGSTLAITFATEDLVANGSVEILRSIIEVVPGTIGTL